MKEIYKILFIFLISINSIYALTWEDCLNKYEKVKLFTENTRLSYIYLKATKSCLVKFKNSLINNPNPEFSIKAMNENILMLTENINNLIPQYIFPKNTLEHIPKYLDINKDKPIINKEYLYLKRFKNCNGVHAGNKIFTAKHCKINKSTNLQFDINYIKTKKYSNLKIAKLLIHKKGTFKYYSMSREGMFYNALIQEKNCKFYKAKNTPDGLNTSLDLTSLVKKNEIRSTCLAIPSNSGGGVFQEGKLVAIISKTVFIKNKFSYSVIEPILAFPNTNTK